MREEDILTYEELLQLCLDQVPNNVDKRQGSIIFDAIAPCCVELAKLYIKLYGTFNLAFVDTSAGDYLTMLAEQNGVIRKDATNAIRKGEFNLSIPIGSRFSDGTLTYIVTETDTTDSNNSILKCEQLGEQGNQYYGSLIPITYITGITKAELTDIIDAGTDIESDDELRLRYAEFVTAPAFGGNVADYKNKTKEIVGVGGCKVTPIWNGGGSVKLTITSSTHGQPTQALIDSVQNEIDPLQDSLGQGIAPIGHIVTVAGANTVNINISGDFVLSTGITAQSIQTKINEQIDLYLSSLSSTWDTSDMITVRLSQIETRLLNVSGVIDISNVKINNMDSNIELNYDEVPLRETDVNINV